MSKMNLVGKPIAGQLVYWRWQGERCKPLSVALVTSYDAAVVVLRTRGEDLAAAVADVEIVGLVKES